MSNIKKIVLFGPESTGKTWLAERLADHYRTVWVAEYARTYLESKKKYYNFYGNGSEEICLQEDILPIVLGQMAIEDLIEKNAHKLIFYDTNPLQTKVYVNHYYRTDYAWLLKVLEERHYDFYLLTNTDVAWKPDALRDRPENRDDMFLLFKTELEKRKLPFAIVSGTDQERMQKAIAYVDGFMK